MDVKKVYTSERQKELMVEWLSQPENEVLVSGKFSQTFSMKDAENKWKELSLVLNAVPHGATKTWKSWRNTWQDIRSRTKSKEARNIASRNKTGGGPCLQESLSQYEQSVIELIKPVSIEGHGDVEESAVIFDLGETGPSHVPITHNLPVFFDVSEAGHSQTPIIRTTNEAQNIESSTNEGDNSEEHLREEYQVNEDVVETEVQCNFQRTVPKRGSIKLKQTSAAVGSYERYLEMKIKIKEDYYTKKLEFLRLSTEAQIQTAEAMKKIVQIFELKK